MDEVRDLRELRVRRVAGRLRPVLEEQGSVSELVDELTVAVDVWRAAARRVGRELGRPIRTGFDLPLVWAALDDWPANDDERRRTEEAMRAAVRAASL